MQAAVAYFAIRLVLGISVAALGVLGRGVVSAWFRIASLLLLGLSVLAAVAGVHFRPGGLALCGCAFAGSIFWRLERRKAGAFTLALIAVLAAVELCVSAPSGSGPAPFTLGLFSALAGAATLGTAMCGMLLGHRYLTAPGMPLAPLVWINQAMLWAAIIRCAASAAALMQYPDALSNSTHAVWLALRWLAGIGGPCVAWYLVRRILVYRNTQSATGVLFVAVILTFIGELTGDLLRYDTGVPY